MQLTEKQIAEIFDYSRFEPSQGMEKIISAFDKKFDLSKKSAREKVTFEELSGGNTVKTTHQPRENKQSLNAEKKGKTF